jgi:ribosomal protein L29
MKKNDLQNLRSKDISKLKGMVKDKKLELIKIKSSVKAGKEKNLKRFKNKRRELAQILTLIREKEIAEGKIHLSDKQKGKVEERKKE